MTMDLTSHHHVFLTTVSACSTGGGFRWMSCFPQHISNDNEEDDDICLVRLSSVCSCAIDKLSLVGGFLSNEYDDVKDNDEVSSQTGRCQCLPLVGGGFGDLD